MYKYKGEKKKRADPVSSAAPVVVPDVAVVVSAVSGGDGNLPVPVNPSAPIGSNGKPMISISKIIKKTRPVPGSGVVFSKGVDGVLQPACEHKKSKTKKPKKWTDGNALDDRQIEVNDKSRAAIEMFKALPTDKAFAIINNYCDDDAAAGMKREQKINDRVQNATAVMDRIAEEASNEEWSKIYPGIIGIAAETMGWEGSNARNPMLVKLFMKMITIAMTKSKINLKKKDSGMFTIYLSWAMEKLQEKKFNKIAEDCIMATCFQYGPKLVFTAMEKFITEPENPAKDPFKNEKSFGPVIKFMHHMVKEFGVDNCYPLRMLRLVHKLSGKSRKKDAKEACYNFITEMYQQLGDSMKGVCYGPLGKAQIKVLTKNFAAIKNPGYVVNYNLFLLLFYRNLSMFAFVF